MDPRTSFFESKLESLAPRYKDLYLLGIIGTTISVLLLLILVFNDPRLYEKTRKNNYISLDRHCSAGIYHASTICTEGCRIPIIAEDNSLQKWFENEYSYMLNMQACKGNPLLGSNKTHIWVERDNMRHYNLTNSSNFKCCYRSFYRVTPSFGLIDYLLPNSHLYKYSDCRNFIDTIKVNDEFVRVTCTGSEKLFDTFFVSAPEKEPTIHANLPYNVLILGLDGVSRLNFHRTMPKTVELLKDLGAIELFGYNKVADNTLPNLIPLLMGMTEKDLERACMSWEFAPFDSCPFIWKQYQKAGFLTALAEDISHLGTFNYNRRGFIKAPTDYYLYPFIDEAETNAGNNLNDYIMLCMNEKFFFKLLLDYVEDLTALKNKLFGFFWECTMSHHDLYFPMLMDDSYSGFFRRLNSSGYLNDTIIFLISDHGIRYGGFRQTKLGVLEERLPLAFLLMPPSFRNNFDVAFNNLVLNSRHLTTPFDMHATLADLVNLDNIKNEVILSRSKEAHLERGISLFLPISGNRTCKSAGIEDHWCTCYRHVKLGPYNADGKDAVSHTISHMNRILEWHPQCSKLSLDNVLEVTQLLSEGLKKGSMELLVMFRTVPGGGIFEATLVREHRGEPWTISGTVSRLNLYGNQSYCVSDIRVVMYCYCSNLKRDFASYESKTVSASERSN